MEQAYFHFGSKELGLKAQGKSTECDWGCLQETESDRSSDCISLAWEVAWLIYLCIYLFGRKEYWEEKGRGRARVAKMCEFLVNLMDSADDRQVQALLPAVHKRGQTTRLQKDSWVQDWDVTEEGDPETDLISGNSAMGTLCSFVVFTCSPCERHNVDTCHLGSGNNSHQCQSTTSMTYSQSPMISSRQVQDIWNFPGFF